MGLVPFLLCYGLEEFWERNRSIMSCSCRDPILSLGLLTVSPSKTLQRFYSTSTNQAKLGIALFLQGLNTLAVETKVLEGPMALFSVWCICPAQRGMSALHKDTQMAFFFFLLSDCFVCSTIMLKQGKLWSEQDYFWGYSLYEMCSKTSPFNSWREKNQVDGSDGKKWTQLICFKVRRFQTVDKLLL